MFRIAWRSLVAAPHVSLNGETKLIGQVTRDAFDRNREGALPAWVALRGDRDLPQRGYMEWPDNAYRPRNRLSLLYCPVCTSELKTYQVGPELLDQAIEM